MKFEEVISSEVQPVPNQRIDFNIDNIEKSILSSLSNKNVTLLEIYNNISIKSNNNLIKDITQNIEHLIKTKNLNTENIMLITNIFNIIKLAVQTLETSNINRPEYTEIFTTIFSTVFSHYKKFFLEVSSNS